MKKKVLFVATVLRGHILVFHLPYMQWFQQQGYEVHVCARNDTDEGMPQVPFCDRYVDMSFQRSPLSAGNVKVYRQLKALMSKEKYALVHCHTPVGGMLGRLCARGIRREGARVIYTAHGFHFFTGAKPINWLVFYPVERWLSRYTDLLITINQEDEKRARTFHAGRVELVNGVGIDTQVYSQSVNREVVRRSVGIPAEAKVIITVGEHIPRKNHQAVLRTVARVPEAWLILCGVGEEMEALQTLAKELGIEHRALFLGFRRDVAALLKASDVFFFPSYQEGLPVSLMEAMAAGLPCVASCVRGNTDLLQQEKGGTLRPPDDVTGFAMELNRLLQDDALRKRMALYNRQVIRAYALPNVQKSMIQLYLQQLKEGAEG